MSFLRTPDTTISNTAPIAAGVRVQTSAFGRCIPLLYGRTRVAPNLCWYGAFTPIAHTETTESGGGGKGGGGSVKQVNTSYTYTTGLLTVIGEGLITAILNTWLDKAQYSGSYGMSLFTGSYSQAAWSFLVSNFPGQDITYRGLAYAAHEAFPLGDQPGTPNITFEVDANAQNLTAYGKYDADPKDIVVDILTNAKYGIGFPSGLLGDLTAWSNYCRAVGILISPAYVEQQQASEIIQELADISNTGVYFSEGQFKATPYSDEAASGNGATYTPNATPLYDLGPDDFEAKDDPILVERSNVADAFNQLQVKCYDRSNWYAEAVVEAKDQANIEEHGLRPKDPVDYHQICDTNVGRVVAQHRLQRVLYIRNVYRFRLSAKYILLEPTDLVTITDDALGLNRQLVRICTVEEDDSGSFNIEAEEVPTNVSAPAVYSTQTIGGYQLNYNVDPGDCMTPKFFEAPVDFSTTGLSVGIAVTGNSALWGGAEVWVSYDNATYKRQGIVAGGARCGTITANMSASQGVTCSVQLAGNGGQINGGTAQDAQNAATLCIVGDEFLSYTTATLTGANRYDLTAAQRGQFGTSAVAHTTGAQFVRVDDAVVYSDGLDISMIGQTIWVKCLSFNAFGGGRQTLDQVTAIPYTITGVMASLPPSSVTNFNATPDITGVLLTWDEIDDHDRKDYHIRQGVSWAAGVGDVIVAATERHVAPLDAIPYKWWIKARDQLLVESLNAASAVLTINGPLPTDPSIVVNSNLYQLTWSPPYSEFQIDHYEIRYGASWAAGTPVGSSKTTIFSKAVDWLGSRTFWVAGVDIKNNVGSAGSETLNITAPSQPSVSAQVIDNNVLLSWSDATASLPILSYEVRKGDTYAGATVIGTKQGRFTTVFESESDTYTYWITGIDSAGNYGTPGQTSAQVSQPPDYQLKQDWFTNFANGSLSNALFADDAVTMPVNTTETWDGHFTSHNWSSIQDQINAGYPIYIEPVPGSGYYEETFDYNTTLAGCKVTVTPTFGVTIGAPTWTCNISTSNNGSNWTTYANQTSAFATNFRYVKARITTNSANGTDLQTMSKLEIKLDVKLKNDAGMLYANSADANGTTANFSTQFIDITSIVVSPQGNTNLNAVYNFQDVPNPSNFSVYVFDNAGARASGNVSWTAKGY